MEITMTLTVTPKLAAAIANLLTDAKTTDDAIGEMRAQAAIPPVPNSAPTVQQSSPIPQSMPQPVPMTSAAPIAQAVPTQQAPPIQQGIPTQIPTYTVQDLALACRPLMEAGKQAELQALLVEFGAPAGINSIPENRRTDFAARLRQMGGQI